MCPPSGTARTPKIQLFSLFILLLNEHIFQDVTTCRTKLLIITWEVAAYLVFFQKFQFDRYVVTHFVVFLFVHLKQLLWLFNLWQSVCITRAQIQLFQVCSISIVFNPGKKEVKRKKNHLRAVPQNWPQIYV